MAWTSRVGEARPTVVQLQESWAVSEGAEQAAVTASTLGVLGQGSGLKVAASGWIVQLLVLRQSRCTMSRLRGWWQGPGW